MRREKIVYLGNVGEPNSASAIHVHNRSLILKEFGIRDTCNMRYTKK